MIPRPTGEHDVERIETFERNGLLVFRIDEDLTVYSKFEKLSTLVKQALQQGKANIVFIFTPTSYLNTRLISNLVHYWNLAREHGGSLGLVRPNQDILDVLSTIGLLELMTVYASEEDIGKA